MENADLMFWRSIAVKMTEQVEKAVSPLIGKKEAGDIIKMGADGTPSKLIDLVAEDEVISVLESASQPVKLISEEIGELEIGSLTSEISDEFDASSENISGKIPSKQIIFVVDPLDGTSNAVKNIPIFGISVAIAEYSPGKKLPCLDDVKMGFVKDFATGDFYEGIKGQGAFLNGEKMVSSPQTELNHSSMGAFIYGTKFSQIDDLSKKIRRIRILGSVAIELSYVANGSYDAFLDLRGNLRIVDIAASKLIVEESGGIVTNQLGLPVNGLLNVKDRTSLIAAGNEELHKKIMEHMGVI